MYWYYNKYKFDFSIANFSIDQIGSMDRDWIFIVVFLRCKTFEIKSSTITTKKIIKKKRFIFLPVMSRMKTKISRRNFKFEGEKLFVIIVVFVKKNRL